MTDAEREEDDRRMDLKAHKKDEAKQFNFLQKYYHRGGFFQDKAVSGEEPLYLRDYHEPLEEEKFDKKMLPGAMQLRRGQFGKKGQVKHTHLTEVDTTDMSAAWAQSTKQIERRAMAAFMGRRLLQEEDDTPTVTFPDDYPNSVRHFLLIGFLGMFIGAIVFFYMGISRKVNTVMHVLTFFVAAVS